MAFLRNPSFELGTQFWKRQNFAPNGGWRSSGRTCGPKPGGESAELLELALGIDTCVSWVSSGPSFQCRLEVRNDAKNAGEQTGI